MSTQVKAFESIVVSAPIEAVWQFLRPFDAFPPRLTGAPSHITNGLPPDVVGAIREIRIPNVGSIDERLTALSDEDHLIEYALLTAGFNGLYNYVSTVQLFPVTATNETFISWKSTFTSDTPEQSLQGISELYKGGLANVKKHFAQS